MSLEMRPQCERCSAVVRPDGEAFICSHECTFCPTCSQETQNVCPNCGGELTPRPRRQG
jgi:hypothetical protein